MTKNKNYTRLTRFAILTVAAAFLLLPFLFGSNVARMETVNDRIIYQTSNQIYVMDADGANKTFITQGANPSFSADGTKIV